MNMNVGSVDRVIRVVAGVALTGLAAAGTIGPWGYVGVLPLHTGFMRVCPAYSLLGVNTRSSEKAGKNGR
jgi:hypothetical protein